MSSVLEVVLGEGARKLTASVVSDLKKSWTTEFSTWKKRDLSSIRFSYIYADGIYQSIRGDNPKICVLVIVGVDADGRKHLVTLEDGVRESTQSWREVLLDLKSRGMAEPLLAIGDGAMGFWAALAEIYPGARHQRCWMHKTQNILNYLPKSLQSKAKSDIQAIWMAHSRAEAEKAVLLFRDKYQAKYERAVHCLTKDREELLRFYDFPAEHWIRTTNAIESTFSTLRHRTKKVKGAFSKSSAMSMMYQLALEAEKSWRRIKGAERLAEIIRGVRFTDGIAEELAS
jgi:transposase-like protein